MQFPEPLLNELKEHFSIDEKSFLEAHRRPAPVSLRLNLLKADLAFEPAGQVPWAAGSFYLASRPSFTNDPLFHAGCYYVQEASSMFLQEAIKQTVDLSQKIIALDACAAPGGKSTLMASLLNEQSLLLSNEVISTRVPALVHNMVKWGTTNSVVSNNDPKDFSRLPGFFDLMVVDAPCSGSGLFRKQEDAVEHWSEEHVKHCSLRQQRILHDLLPSLKKNGILIYSTCSYSAEENENVSDQLIEQYKLQPLQLNIQPTWQIVETKSKRGAWGYRFFPDKVKGEGFFLSCFRKTTEENQAANSFARKNKTSQISSAEEKAVEQFLKAENFEFIKQGEEIVGYPAAISEEVKQLGTLKLKKMPVHAGQLKGRDFIPHPYSAYLVNIAADKIDVDHETALKFLRKQPFTIDGPQKGFQLLTYKNRGLGWLKNLGNRVNNYYPAEWRILQDTNRE